MQAAFGFEFTRTANHTAENEVVLLGFLFFELVGLKDHLSDGDGRFRLAIAGYSHASREIEAVQYMLSRPGGKDLKEVGQLVAVQRNRAVLQIDVTQICDSLKPAYRIAAYHRGAQPDLAFFLEHQIFNGQGRALQ